MLHAGVNKVIDDEYEHVGYLIEGLRRHTVIWNTDINEESAVERFCNTHGESVFNVSIKKIYIKGEINLCLYQV
jgi:hypothetical protein